MNISIRKIMLIPSLCMFCISCAGLPEVMITEDTVYDIPCPRVEHEYLLGPGDVLEIIYHYNPQPDLGEYRLAVGDVIKVEFSYHKDITRTLTVRPDGNIALPRKGDVRVIGLTPTQVKEKLTKLFSNDFKDPLITITMVQYNRAIEHLKKAITTAPRGQSKLTTIRPDGYISFPIIEDIKAARLTLPKLRHIASKEYSKLIDHLTISLILKTMKANLVYVTGEVVNPNVYLMEGPTTVVQSLAIAGGVKDTAQKKTILVISRDKDRKPWGRLVNLKNIIREGNISLDITLNQYDIVYVPKSAIARADLWVEQYINRIMPEFISANYNLGGTLIDNEPVITHNR